MEAQFVHGNPTFVRYKRGTAIAAGEVIQVGAMVMIAHNNFAANEEASLSVGPGTYRATAGAALGPGVACGWDNTAKEVVAVGDFALGLHNPVSTSTSSEATEFYFNPN